MTSENFVLTANCASGRVLRVRCCWDRLGFIVDARKNECQLEKTGGSDRRCPIFA